MRVYPEGCGPRKKKKIIIIIIIIIIINLYV